MPIPKGYKRKRLVKNYKRVCAIGSVRTVVSAHGRILVCCPKGHWSKSKRCHVGTRAIAIDRKFGNVDLSSIAARMDQVCRRINARQLFKGARIEHREHPEFSKRVARMIARDHLCRNPKAYSKK